MKRKTLLSKTLLLMAAFAGGSVGISAADYVKVTSTSDLSDGTYLIVYEEGNVALNGGLTDKLDAVSNTISVTISDSKIASSETTDAAAFTYDASAKTLKGAGSLYMGQTSDANGMQSSASTTYENTISFDDDGNVNIVSGSAYLRYNDASNQTRFRYFKSSTYTNQKAIQLYKLESDGTPTKTNIATITGISPTEVNVNETGTFTLSYNLTEGVGEDDVLIGWSTSDEEVLMVDDESGQYAAIAAGTANVTVTIIGEDTYNEVSKTFAVTVTDPNAPGMTAENPYTVAQARAAIDANSGITGVYAKGIVSSIAEEYSDYYGNISFFISEDGTTTGNQLEAFRCVKGEADGAPEVSDIQVGDKVVIYGNLKKYNSTYEFDAKCYVVSRVTLKENAINGLEDTYTIDLTKNEYEIEFTATATSGDAVKYEVVAEETTVKADNYVLDNGTLTVDDKGTIVIRAYVDANDEYKAAEKTTTVTVLGEKDEAVIFVEDATIAYGETYTIDTEMIEGGDITVTSSNESVATVDGLVITPKAVGNVTITVSTAENDIYQAGSKSFVLTVTAPEGLTAAPEFKDEVMFYESFDKNSSTGGNDNKWSGTIATAQTISFDNTGWNTSGGSGANKCAKFGTTKLGGSATTPAISLAAGTYTLTFKAGAWNTESEGTTLSLSVQNATLSKSSVTMTKAAFTDYSVTLTVKTASDKVYITFSTPSKNNRFFLDEVKVVKPAEEPSVTVTLAASGYATYCSEYPLDFSQNDKSVYRAWYVSDVNDTEVTFTEIEGSVKGGTPVILYGTPGAACELTYGDSETTLDDNMLVGTLAPTWVSGTETDGSKNYGLSGGEFKQISEGVVKANKAYLNVPATAGSRLRIVFAGNTSTSVSASLNEKGEMINEKFFDLQGRRVAQPTKGLYIVNGKKYVK